VYPLNRHKPRLVTFITFHIDITSDPPTLNHAFHQAQQVRSIDSGLPVTRTGAYVSRTASSHSSTVELKLLSLDELRKRQVSTISNTAHSTELMTEDASGVNCLKAKPAAYSKEYDGIHQSRIVHPVYKHLEQIGRDVCPVR
jgi:hypothetical protein